MVEIAERRRITLQVLSNRLPDSIDTSPVVLTSALIEGHIHSIAASPREEPRIALFEPSDRLRRDAWPLDLHRTRRAGLDRGRPGRSRVLHQRDKEGVWCHSMILKGDTSTAVCQSPINQ
jgi:hypothetical protein